MLDDLEEVQEVNPLDIVEIAIMQSPTDSFLYNVVVLDKEGEIVSVLFVDQEPYHAYYLQQQYLPLINERINKMKVTLSEGSAGS